MQISKAVVAAAAVAFVGLVAAVSFLLGRESVRRRPATALTAAPARSARRRAASSITSG